MRFSVLIPVYNVEKYLDQCLKSVLSQDYEDFEIILVNDGSTDNSSSICRKYAEKDSRIKLYERENVGLLLTRRFSINQASGEYLVFLDSDDYWEPGVLYKLNEAIKTSNADMICYRFRVVTDEGKSLYEDIDIFTDKTMFTASNKEQFLQAFLSSTKLNNIWLKCVRSTIVDKDEDYKSFDDKKGEDILQSIALIRNANSILYLNDVFVNYRMSPSGRGRNFKVKYVDDYEAVKQHVYKNLVQMNASNAVMYTFYKQYIERLISFLGAIAVTVKNYEAFIEECKHIQGYLLYKESSSIIKTKDIISCYRCEYKSMKNHHYFIIYYTHRIKKTIRKIISH